MTIRPAAENIAPPPVEVGCCELFTTCKLLELTKRVAKAVCQFFIALVTSPYWICKKAFECITGKNTQNNQQDNGRDVNARGNEQRDRNVRGNEQRDVNARGNEQRDVNVRGNEQRDVNARGNEQRDVNVRGNEQRDVNARENEQRDRNVRGNEFGREVNILAPRQGSPGARVDGAARDVEALGFNRAPLLNFDDGSDDELDQEPAPAARPTVDEQVTMILSMGSTSVELREIINFVSFEEQVAMRLAIARTEAKELRDRAAVRPAANAPAQLADADDVDDVDADPAAEEGSRLPPEAVAANRQEALARIQELKAAVENGLQALRAAGTDLALKKLAEMDAGAEPGILTNVSAATFQQLKNLPPLVRDSDWSDRMKRNPARERILPGGTFAADRLFQLRSEIERRPAELDAHLLRLAQIQVLERYYSVAPQVIAFNIDAVLAGYSQEHPTQSLVGWYDTAKDERGQVKNAQGRTVSQYDYAQAVNRYQHRSSTQERTACKYLSYIHDVLAKKQTAIGQSNPAETKIFKEAITKTICAIVDANGNCIDQMTSQLENILLDLIAYHQSAGTLEEQLKFKAGLALCQQRAALINMFTVKFYPEEPHMADLEREVKKQGAQLGLLVGEGFEIGAQYAGVINGQVEKGATVAQAVLNHFNAPLFLLDQTQAARNDVRAMFYLRAALTEEMTKHVLDLVPLDEDNPLVQGLALDPSGETGTAAYEGGPLSFEGTIYYLQKMGILLPNHG